MYPILTRLGPFFIYTYTAVFALGLWLVWVVIKRHPSSQNLADWPNAALAALAAGWLGGRLSFILLNWPYYAAHPPELFRLWLGGQTTYGGLIGGLVGLWLWSRWARRPFLAYANLFAPALLLLSATGWAACWLEGCAFGAETILGSLSADLPDSFGVFAVRFQTQLVGILLNLMVFGLMLWWQKRRGDRRLLLLSLLGANLIHFVLTLLRGDDVLTLAGWRLDSWLALMFVSVALFLLQYDP